MKMLGVKFIIAPNACGSLAKHVKPGSMVVCGPTRRPHQRTQRYLFDGPITTHVSFADPYCPTLRPIAIGALKSSISRRTNVERSS